MPDTLSKIPPRKYARSSSFQMALLFTVLCGVAVVVLGYFSYYFHRGYFIHGTEAVIDTEIRYIASLAEPENVRSHDDRLYAFFGPGGSRPDDIPSSVSLLSEGIILFDHPQRERRYAAKIHTFEDGRKILVGIDISDISEDYRFMQNLSILSIVLMVIVVAVSYLISAFVVSGTNRIADTARNIMNTGNLSRRVEIGSRWDDLSNMAAVLNALLERIEQLMQGVRQVSDNIAHDLRTPLTRLRNHIETLKKQNDDPAYDDLLKEADHLLDTFNALLRISRIEAEKQRGQFREVNLQDLMRDVVEYYEPLAEEKNITLRSALKQASCRGDRDLLFQAYANLLDNAIKFTPEGGTVHVALENGKDGARIEMTDSGPGIPEEDRERVFNRFYRGETCRSTSGTGLGLSLVAAVIDLHHGRIELENADPGVKIITIL